jgi:hypothetical protein
MRNARGQSSVEYATVLAAVLSLACALALVWHAAQDASLLDRVVVASSHQWGGGALDALRDLVLF